MFPIVEWIKSERLKIMKKVNSIFLCAPYTNTIDDSTELINEAYKSWLTEIISYLRRKSDTLYNSHTREEWGAKLSSPKEAVMIDFAQISSADYVVAYIGDPPSSGVLVELGFAASLKKPIIIFTESGKLIPYFAQGLKAWTNVTEISFDNLDDLFKKLENAFASYSTGQE